MKFYTSAFFLAIVSAIASSTYLKNAFLQITELPLPEQKQIEQIETIPQVPAQPKPVQLIDDYESDDCEYYNGKDDRSYRRMAYGSKSNQYKLVKQREYSMKKRK